MITNCGTCSTKPHSQDELHGKGKRVLNEHSKKVGTSTVIVSRCTVCGTETQRTLDQEKK